MLVDVEFKTSDSGLLSILEIISDGGGPVIPERIGKGLYVSGHWSVEYLGVPVRKRWAENGVAALDFDEYGVCDTPEQVVNRFHLESRPEKFFVSFVKIDRAAQPQDGGWRWHKWGPYIGTREPRCEYIADEPEIESVYTYRIYELRDGQEG